MLDGLCAPSWHSDRHDLLNYGPGFLCSKLDNVLLTKGRQGTLIAKLSDFGLFKVWIIMGTMYKALLNQAYGCTLRC